MSVRSPAMNPARNPAMFERFDNEWTTSTPSAPPPSGEDASAVTGAAGAPSAS